MPNQGLSDFIKKSKVAGQADDEIKSALKSAGWQEGDIEEGFLSSSNQSAPPISPTSESPTKPAQNYSDLLYGTGKRDSAVITQETKSSKKLIATIVVFFILLAGVALAYYFKNDFLNVTL